MPPPLPLNSKFAQLKFNQTHQRFAQHANLFKEVQTRLLDRLDFIHLKPKRILDLGCGVGLGLAALKERFAEAEVVALDIAEQRLGMIDAAEVQRVCADMQTLPFKNQLFDLVISNLALCWCNEASDVLKEVQRLLTPGGLMLMSSFGPDTLKELRAICQQVDPQSQRVHSFWDMHDLGDAMRYLKLHDATCDCQWLTVEYTDADHLFQRLKGTAMVNQLLDRPNHLGQRTALKQIKSGLDAQASPGPLTMTYELIFLNAWGSPGRQKTQSASQSGPKEVEFSLDSIEGLKRNKDNKPKGTVIFDFDSTLINCESLEVILDPILSANPKLKAQYQGLCDRAMAGELDFFDSLNERLKLAQPSRTQVQAFSQQAEQFISNGMHELIAELQGKGIATWILSGGLRESILPLAADLNIPKSQVWAVEPIWNETQTHATLDRSDLCSGQKFRAAESLSSMWQGPTVMVGDGFTDYEVYQHDCVDHFIAYSEHQARESVIQVAEYQAADAQALRAQLKTLGYL